MGKITSNEWDVLLTRGYDNLESILKRLKELLKYKKDKTLAQRMINDLKKSRNMVKELEKRDKSTKNGILK